MKYALSNVISEFSFVRYLCTFSKTLERCCTETQVHLRKAFDVFVLLIKIYFQQINGHLGDFCVVWMIGHLYGKRPTSCSAPVFRSLKQMNYCSAAKSFWNNNIMSLAPDVVLLIFEC